LLSTVCVSAIWILIQFLFPHIDGLWGFKVTAVVLIASVSIWAAFLLIKQGSQKKSGPLDRRGRGYR
jgi:hypothetical protein